MRILTAIITAGLALGPAAAQPGKSIYVDLSTSKVYAVQNGGIIKQLTTNPGKGQYATKPGRYSISEKILRGKRSNLWDVHNRPLKKGGEGAPMPYWMRLGSTGQGFHRSSLWSASGRPASHGCLRLSRSGARWLFQWAPKGTPVYVVQSAKKAPELVALLPQWRERRIAIASAKTGGSAASKKAGASASSKAAATAMATARKPKAKKPPVVAAPPVTTPPVTTPPSAPPPVEPTPAEETPATPTSPPAETTPPDSVPAPSDGNAG